MAGNKKFSVKNGLDLMGAPISNAGTLGSSLSQAGAFNVTITAVADTNVTLPASGPLASANYMVTGSATSRLTASKLQENISAADFGAVGDNSTDDSAAFSLLEAQAAGARIDLLSKTYLVTSVPKNCRYFNGHFRVGSTTYSLPASPLSHPLAGPIAAIDESKRTHTWPGPVGNLSTTDALIRTYVGGWRHSTSLNAPLVSQLSYDGGMTWESPRTVYANASFEPRGLVGGMISSTRYGVFYVLIDSASTRQGTRFSYTDDAGTTWTTVTVPTSGMYSHGEFVADDGGGINVFGYGTALSGNIYRARSLDAGATWTVTIVKTSAAPLNLLVEPTVVKIASNRYIMFARDDGGGTMRAATSADLTTWSAWADTNIPLGANPPLAIMAWGRLWVYCCARRGNAINSWEDKLLVAELDAGQVYSAGGAIAAGTALRVVVENKKSSIGYLTVAQLRDGSWIGFMTDGETLNGSANPQTTRTVRLGGSAPVLAAPALLNTRRTQPPITHNPCFNHWTRGSGFSSITSATPTADRWMNTSSGSGVTVSQVEVADAIRKVVPACGLYAMSLSGDVGGSGRGVSQRFYGKNKIIPMLDRVTTMNCIFSGDLPGYFRARVILNFGVGGSASRIVEFTDCAQRSSTSAYTLLTATGYTPSADAAVWGTNPYLQFMLLSNDAGVAAATIYALWWDWADGYIPLDPPDFDAERSTLDQYTQRLTWNSGAWVGLARGNGSANTEIDVKFGQMVALPTLTSDTAANVQVNGVGLSALSFDMISQQSARMIGTLSSGVLAGNNVGVVSVTPSTSWSLLADVKY